MSILINRPVLCASISLLERLGKGGKERSDRRVSIGDSGTSISKKNTFNKAIIIDTNGTIYPDKKTINLLRRKDVLIRVSWDIPHPAAECELRVYRSDMYESPAEYMASKEILLRSIIEENILIRMLSIQDLLLYNIRPKKEEIEKHKTPIKYKECK